MTVQRLIFYGRSLTNPALSLLELDAKSKSKFMLIGKRPGQVEPQQMAALKIYITETERLEAKLVELNTRLDGYNKALFKVYI